MLKLLALFVLIWIFFKALGMVIKMVFGSADTCRSTRYTDTSNRKQDGKINVDHNPNKSNKGYEGGEYVDYEDID
jgi:hypothetical protein